MDALHLFSSEQLCVHFLSSLFFFFISCSHPLHLLWLSVVLSTPRGISCFKQSNYTHTHTPLPALSSPIISSPSSSEEMSVMFWVWLARTWLQSGLGSHDGLTFGVMLFCSIMSCSETLLRVFPSLWVNLQLNSGQTEEKR